MYGALVDGKDQMQHSSTYNQYTPMEINMYLKTKVGSAIYITSVSYCYEATFFSVAKIE